MEKVLVLWKTSCLILVSKLGQPVELIDYRPVALTSHIMKTFERLLVRCIRLQVAEDLDPLQFAYQKQSGRRDSVHAASGICLSGCAWFICENHVL